MNTLETYLVWYRDERINTQYGMDIHQHWQELGLVA